jgi:LmbE family N-acetylglucosaminyl deacetylase
MTARAHRMLCVFAHPDDECLGPGGTIAHYAMRGVEVYLLTFTCGEAGSIGVSKELPPDELCRRRLRELEGACEALRIREHRIVGVADKGVSGMDPARGVAEVTADIERYRPDVVLTFHHEGVSSHPDHIAVAGFLDAAVAAAGDDGPFKYYQWGIPRSLSGLYERPNLVPMEDEEVAAVVEVPEAAMDRKIAAIERHVTQIEFFRSLQEKFDYRSVAAREYFALRASRVPPAEGVESDLFGGVPGWGGS